MVVAELGFLSIESACSTDEEANAAGVEVKAYKVIYDLLDDMRKVMEGQLSTVEERILLGVAEVRPSLPPSFLRG